MAKNEKILGLDIGAKRTGVAVFDVALDMIFPRDTIEAKNFDGVLKSLKQIVSKENISKIIVGLPLDEEERERRITRFVKTKAALIEEKLGIPVEFIDEAFSTQEGVARLSKYKLEYRDMMSAVVILERYRDQKMAS